MVECIGKVTELNALNYIETDWYKEMISREDNVVQVITGRSGVGKTQAVVQHLVKLEGSQNNKVECLVFDCETDQGFKEKVSKLRKRYKIENDSEDDEDDEHFEEADRRESLRNAFRGIVKRFQRGEKGNQMKLLVFDNAQPGDISSKRHNIVLKCIEDLCSSIQSELPKWKIFITSCKSKDQWQEHCSDRLNKMAYFCHAEEFNLEQMRQFLKIPGLTDDDKGSLFNHVGGLPSALGAIKDILKNYEQDEVQKRVRLFLRALQGNTRTALTCRVLLGIHPKTGEEGNHVKLMQMISLYGERPIPMALLEECSAVLLDKLSHKSWTQEVDRSNPSDPGDNAHSLIADLKKQCLAPVARRDTQEKQFDVSKLILPSVRHRFQEEPHDYKTERIIEALIALIRTIPSEGRKRLSMTSYSDFLTYGISMTRHIGNLKDQKALPSVLRFLQADLLASMSYCQMVRRASLGENKFLEAALEAFSLAVCGEKYGSLVQSHPFDHTKKADHLVQKIFEHDVNGTSKCKRELIDDADYCYAVRLAQNLRMPRREVWSMLCPSENQKMGDYYSEEDGQIKLRCRTWLKDNNREIALDRQYFIYLLEKLVEIYSIGAKVPQYYWSPDTDDSKLYDPESYADAALSLCEKVTEKYEISLRLHPIVKRLKISITAQRSPSELAVNRATISALKEKPVDGEYWYEYGLGTTNFSTDLFFQYVYHEDELLSLGRYVYNLLHSAQDADEYIQKGKEMISTLQEQCESFKNKKILAKFQMKQAMFLSWSKDQEGAVKLLLDAMISLESFLQQSGFTKRSEYTSGLFRNLHEMLDKYWRHWYEAINKTAVTMLEIGNADGERLRFIKELLEKFPNEDQFQVFVHLGSERPVGVQASN